MIGVITGDIINSRSTDSAKEWLDILRGALGKFGKEGLDWEIYRGDSFQLEISQPKEALITAIYIKACMKTIKGRSWR
jgi:hypothetical protein